MLLYFANMVLIIAHDHCFSSLTIISCLEWLVLFALSAFI